MDRSTNHTGGSDLPVPDKFSTKWETLYYLHDELGGVINQIVEDDPSKGEHPDHATEWLADVIRIIYTNIVDIRRDNRPSIQGKQMTEIELQWIRERG